MTIPAILLAIAIAARWLMRAGRRAHRRIEERMRIGGDL